MDKAKELKSTQRIVLDVLRTNPFTRNSDNALYIVVCSRINPAVLKMPFWEVLAGINEFNLPQYETVRRARQKIQAELPELAGEDRVEAMRIINEENFRQYAKGGIG